MLLQSARSLSPASAHDQVEARRRGVARDIVKFAGCLFVDVERTTFGRIAAERRVIVLYVPQILDEGTCRVGRPHGGDIDGSWKRHVNFPQEHLRVVKLLPEGGLKLAVDVHYA